MKIRESGDVFNLTTLRTKSELYRGDDIDTHSFGVEFDFNPEIENIAILKGEIINIKTD